MSLDAIGLVTQDIKTIIPFYQALGVDLEMVGGEGHYEARTPSGVRIMVDTVQLMKSIHPNWERHDGGGVALCFDLKSVDKVDLTYRTLIELGGVSLKEPWDAFWGQRYASLKDPDGHQIDLFCSF